MTKSEFVERLCAALTVSGSAGLVEKNRVYYTEYIEGETAKGRTEAEVLEELGGPELIANSILQANGYKDRFVDDEAKTYNAYDTPDGDPTTFAQGFEYKGKDAAEGMNGGTGNGDGYNSRAGGNTRDVGAGSETNKGISPKTRLIIILIVAALILIGILVLLIVAIGGIFTLLGPVLIPLLLIFLIYKLIKSLTGK